MLGQQRWRDVPLLLLALLLAVADLPSNVLCIPQQLPNGQAAQAAGPAPDLGRFRRAGCDNFTGDAWQPLRPGYHITVPYGWMNDPHGMFEINGTVHLFFQYNPRALAWGAPFWGHVVSEDLAHWTWLPPALLPDTAYDFNGVWSGAATVTDNGTPVLTYTAASTHAAELGNYFQRQAMAVPEDVSDPLLKRWAKPDTNPFLVQVPPGGTNFQFRDPTEARHAVWAALTAAANPKPLPAGHFALAVGVQSFCMGGAGIYSAPTMAGPWTYQGSLFNQMVPEPNVNGQCMASRTSSRAPQLGPAYGGPCEQFGKNCRMWEVVDFAELNDGVYFLKWDDQSRYRSLFSMEWYVLGNGPWDYSAVHPGLAPPPSPAPSGSSSSSRKRQAGAARKQQQPGGVFGAQEYAGYPGAPSGLLPQSRAQAAAANGSSSTGTEEDDFNNVDNSGAAAMRSLFRGELDGQRFAPARTDYGSVYASMVFRTADRRQVMFSWVYETAAGCEDMCSDMTPPAIAAAGFKGVQTLPRQLSYDPRTRSLRAYPVAETSKLRGKQLFNGTNAAVAAFPATTQLLPVSKVPPPGPDGRRAAASVTARQFEVQAAFTLLPPGSAGTAGGSKRVSKEAGSRAGGRGPGGVVGSPSEFAAGVRVELGSGRFVDVFLKGSVISLAPASPGYAIASLEVWVDKRQAGGATNTTWVEGGPVPVPPSALSSAAAGGGAAGSGDGDEGAWIAPDTPLILSLWVDHGVLEAFAMRGLARVTSRIYPDGDDVAWGASAWAVPPQPTGGLPQGIDRAAAAAAAEAIRPPSVITGMFCWWCRLWSRQRCNDLRCFSAFEKWPKPGDWGMLMDAAVWEMKSAWLPPSC